jgi:hypothetical protein
MHVGHSITFSAYLWYFYVRGQYKSYAPYLKYIHRERFVQDMHFVHMYLHCTQVNSQKKFLSAPPLQKTALSWTLILQLFDLWLGDCDVFHAMPKMVYFHTKNPNLGKFWKPLE